MSTHARPAPVVLVHGMWHSPWHLRTLRSELEARGHLVHTPALHRGSVAADVAAVQSVVDTCPSPPVLMGHSYGGAVVGQVHGASAMVFVAAFVLELGESCAGVGGRPPISPIIREDAHGTHLDASMAGAFLFSDCAPMVAKEAVSMLRLQASGHGRTSTSAAAWKDVPTTYVVCSEDRAFDPQLQRVLARRCDSITVMASSHSPHLSCPGVVAEVITSMGSSRGGRLSRG